MGDSFQRRVRLVEHAGVVHQLKESAGARHQSEARASEQLAEQIALALVERAQLAVVLGMSL